MRLLRVLDRARRGADRLAAALAVIGATILLGAAVTVTSSVVVRIVTGGQIKGDFEIMSVGSGIAILLFLPYCQALRAHVFIDTFTGWLPPSINRAIDGAWLLVMAAAMALLTWRLGIGLDEAWANNDVTVMIRIPLAIVFAAAVIGVAGTAVLAVLAVAAPAAEAASSEKAP